MKHECFKMQGVCAEDHKFGNAIDLTFTIYEGELTLMTGLKNSGMYVVPGILSRRISSYSGSVKFNNQELNLGKNNATFSSGIAVLNGNQRYLENLSFESVLKTFNMFKKKEAAQLLKILDLPRNMKNPSTMQQLLMMIFIAYNAGATFMVFSDIPTDNSKKIERVFEFLKNDGITLLVLDLYGFGYNFKPLVDSFIVVRNGITVFQGEKEQYQSMDNDKIRHLIVGRPFLAREKTTPNSSVIDGSEFLKISHESTKKSISLGRGTTCAILDNYMSIPRNLRDFSEFVSKNLKVEKNGKSLEINGSKDFNKNGIAILNVTDVSSLLFENLSPVENLVLFRDPVIWPMKIKKNNTESFIFDTMVEEYPCLSRILRLKDKPYSRDLSYLDTCALITGRWLCINPDIIVMFSLSMNNDIKEIEWFYSLRNDLAKKGKTIIIISSNLQDLDDENLTVFKY